MDEYNPLNTMRSATNETLQPQHIARSTLSNARSVQDPLSSGQSSAMAPGPAKPGTAFFESSKNVQMNGTTNFNRGPDYHYNNSFVQVIHVHGDSGYENVLGILQSTRPTGLSEFTPTSGTKSPKMSPISIPESPGEMPEGAPIKDLRAQTDDQGNKHFGTYYRHLLTKQRGFPLWIPEPGDVHSAEYRSRGISIGDVGIFTDYGGFEHLFNVCVAKEDPINPASIPGDFLPLDLEFQAKDLQECSIFHPNDYLASSVVKTSSSPLTFVSTESEGAVLVLPKGSKSYDLQNLSAFMKYASANAKRWYRYAKETFGRPAKNGDLRLVVGHDKAAAWGSISFSNLHELESLRFRFKQISVDQSGDFYRWEYFDKTRTEGRSGPDPQSFLGFDETTGSIGAPENQCLFVRTLNVTFQHDVWVTLVAEGIGGTDSPGSLRSFEEHPSKAINDLLLKSRPDAKIAITQDWDWISILQTTDDILLSHEILLARILETHAIRECEGTVFLEARPINQTIAPGIVPIDTLPVTGTSHEVNTIEETRQKKEEVTRKEEEMVSLEEQMRRREEEITRRESEAGRQEERRREEEEERAEYEAGRKAEDDRLQRERRRKEEELRRKELELQHKVEAARKLEMEASKKAEEAKKKEAYLKEEEEQMRKLGEKLKAQTEMQEANRKLEEMRKMAAMWVRTIDLSSSSVPSLDDDFEPDEKWKENLRKNIKDSTQAMVDRAKARRVTELKKIISPEDRVRLENEYKEEMANIKKCAQETYNTELEKEINLRCLLAGAPLVSWSEILLRQQRDILIYDIVDNTSPNEDKSSEENNEGHDDETEEERDKGGDTSTNNMDRYGDQEVEDTKLRGIEFETTRLPITSWNGKAQELEIQRLKEEEEEEGFHQDVSRRQEIREEKEQEERREEENKKEKKEVEERKEGKVLVDRRRLEQDQEWILPQAKNERQAEQIRCNLGEHKRNDGFNPETAWSSTFICSSPNISSPGVAKSPQYPNGLPEISTSARSYAAPGRPSGTLALAINKPLPLEPFASGKRTSGPISLDMYPFSPFPVAAGVSEAERARFQDNFIDEEQEKSWRKWDKKEAERRLRSASRHPTREPQDIQNVFMEHERLHTRLSKIKDLTWNDFPWPLLRPPSTPEEISMDLVATYFQSPWWPEKDMAKTPKDRIKEHIRRWHPDRFEVGSLPRVVQNERENVKLGAKNVVRHLSELLRKENEKCSGVNIWD